MYLGHWEYPGTFNTEDWFGFIYRIIEKDTGMEYIGKKQFHSYSKKQVKGRKNKKTVIKENDWKVYTGSSARLNDEILKKGKENYIFLIESLHKTRGSLFYAEVERQINESVLTAKLPNGQRKFYNGHISAIKFIPLDEHPEELKMRVTCTLNERCENKDNLWLTQMPEEKKLIWKKKYQLDALPVD